MKFRGNHNMREFYNGQPVKKGEITLGTTHKYYVWKTKGDGKVRSAHADRNGKVFRWDDPPQGGHPGQDFNCRCKAIQLTPSMVVMNKRLSRIPSIDPNPYVSQPEKKVEERFARADRAVTKARKKWVRDVNQVYEKVRANEDAAYIKELEDAGLEVPDYLRKRAKRPTRDTIRLASAKETEAIAEKQFTTNSYYADSREDGNKKEELTLAEKFKKLVDSVPSDWKEVFLMFKDFVTGTGPEHRVFSEGSKQVESIKTSEGIRRAKEEFRKKYQDLLLNGSDNVNLAGTSYTNYGFRFFPMGLISRP